MPPVEPTGAASAAAAATSPGPAPGLGKEDFLLLLVTQLQHQDPLDPLKADDFASQLAEFTAMEQQLRTNELLEAQGVRDADRLLQTRESLAVGLIGRTVATDGDSFSWTGASDTLSVPVSADGPSAFRVLLVDGAGEVVHAARAQVQGEGVHMLDLGSAPDALVPGDYSLRIEIEDGDPVRPAVTREVTGVRFDDAGPVLRAAGEEIPLSEVLQITLNP